MSSDREDQDLQERLTYLQKTLQGIYPLDWIIQNGFVKLPPTYKHSVKVRPHPRDLDYYQVYFNNRDVSENPLTIHEIPGIIYNAQAQGLDLPEPPDEYSQCLPGWLGKDGQWVRGCWRVIWEDGTIKLWGRGFLVDQTPCAMNAPPSKFKESLQTLFSVFPPSLRS